MSSSPLEQLLDGDCVLIIENLMMPLSQTTSPYCLLIKCLRDWLAMTITVLWMFSPRTFKFRSPQRIKRRLHSLAHKAHSNNVICPLVYTPSTFQRCMLAIFEDMVDNTMEVFMENFSIYGNSFDLFLKYLKQLLVQSKETNLVLSQEKCHFMVKEKMVLGHKISKEGIEVDKEKSPPSKNYPFDIGASHTKFPQVCKLLQAIHTRFQHDSKATNKAPQEKFPT